MCIHFLKVSFWCVSLYVYYDRIERVQNSFLRFAARQLGIDFDWMPHDYINLRSQFGIPMIKSRFCFADIVPKVLNLHLMKIVITTL